MRRSARLLTACAAMLGASLSLAPAAGAFSDVIAVTTTEDASHTDKPAYCIEEGEPCSLRAATELAAQTIGVGADDIAVSVPAGHYKLNAAKGPLVLGDANLGACTLAKAACPVTLKGAGAASTIIDGQNASRDVRVTFKSPLVTIAGVTLTGGSNGGSGGAIDNENYEGELTIRDSVLSGNSAGNGAAIYDDQAPLKIFDSAITGNVAKFQGGGVYDHQAPFTILRSTVAGNETTEGDGGGLALYHVAGLQTASVIDSTIAENTVTGFGGGIVTFASLQLLHSTVAGNRAGAGGGVDGSKTATLLTEGSIIQENFPTQCADFSVALTGEANLVSGFSTCAFVGPPPIALEAKLGALASNGGLGQTMALLSSSPALNAGASSCPSAGFAAPAEDERGIARPQGSACDLGAFESAADVGVTLSAGPDPVAVGGSLTLGANVVNAGAEALSGVMLTLPVPSGTSFISAPSGCSVAFATSATVTCQLGALAPGQARPIAIVVRPERVGALIEAASVQAEQGDANPANNSATTASVSAIGAPLPGSGPPGPVGNGASGAALLGRLLRFDAHGNVTLRVSCPAVARGGCSEALAIYSSTGTMPATAARRAVRAKLLAAGHVTLAAGRTATVHLHLSAAARRLTRSRASLAARLLLSAHDGANITATHRYAVTLKRAAHRRH